MVLANVITAKVIRAFGLTAGRIGDLYAKSGGGGGVNKDITSDVCTSSDANYVGYHNLANLELVNPVTITISDCPVLKIDNVVGCSSTEPITA